MRGIRGRGGKITDLSAAAAIMVTQLNMKLPKFTLFFMPRLLKMIVEIERLKKNNYRLKEIPCNDPFTRLLV